MVSPQPFSVHTPAADSAATPAVGAEARRACVLLVDDSDVVRDVSRALLEGAGVEVDEAHDGAMAVRMVHEQPARYGLILMDVQMPVLDGLAATRLIRDGLGARTPPIVALTAQASEQEKLHCREAGMLDLVPKPVDPQHLVAVLKRWLASPLRAAVAQTDTGTTPTPADADDGLPQVPGFDRAAGLSCVGGKAALLRAMLARFGASHAGVVAQLRELAAAGNFREARRVAHTVKGAAATLGGTQIASAAERVERALQPYCEGAPAAASGSVACEAAVAELDRALQQALPALRALHVTDERTAAPAAALAASMPQSEAAAFAALRQLLAGNCYAARKAFAALRDKLGADDADWRAAAAAVEALDFQQALARLDARYPRYPAHAGNSS